MAAVVDRGRSNSGSLGNSNGYTKTSSSRVALRGSNHYQEGAAQLTVPWVSRSTLAGNKAHMVANT